MSSNVNLKSFLSSERLETSWFWTLKRPFSSVDHQVCLQMASRDKLLVTKVAFVRSQDILLGKIIRHFSCSFLTCSFFIIRDLSNSTIRSLVHDHGRVHIGIYHGLYLTRVLMFFLIHSLIHLLGNGHHVCHL